MRRALFSLLLSSLIFACGSGDSDDPVDASFIATDASLADGGTAATYLQSCDLEDDQCGEDLFCFGFNARGPHCTHECVSPDDCEAPSAGCSNMGVCKTEE